MITSFCKSWMISAELLASSRRTSFSLMYSSSAHERLTPAGHLCLEAVEAGRGADEHPFPVRATPVDVADVLGDSDDAEVLTIRTEHPDALRARYPDVAALVALHAVDEVALLEGSRADALREHPAVRDRTVGLDVEHSDMGARRVVDVEQRLVGRKAEPGRLLEVVDEEVHI